MKAFTNVLPLMEALTFYGALGANRVQARLSGIGQWLRRGLSRYPDTFELVTPLGRETSCVMTCFRVKDQSSQHVCDALADRYQIHVKHASEGGADAVRLSPHYYNTDHELGQVASAFCEIAGVDPAAWFEDNSLKDMTMGMESI